MICSLFFVVYGLLATNNQADVEAWSPLVYFSIFMAAISTALVQLFTYSIGLKMSHAWYIYVVELGTSLSAGRLTTIYLTFWLLR